MLELEKQHGLNAIYIPIDVIGVLKFITDYFVKIYIPNVSYQSLATV